MADTAGKLNRQYHEMTRPTPEMPPREGRTYFLGRNVVSEEGSDTEIILCVSEFVSRHHCDIFYSRGAFWIKDRKSLNGTFLNGTKIIPYTDRELRFGDIIGLGVSHLATDVNIQASEYFIFRFQACQYELIDLEEDEPDQVTKIIKTSSDKSVSNALKSISQRNESACQEKLDDVSEDSDDEDIQIVEEKISSSNSSPLKKSVSPSPSTSPQQKSKSLPPAPPPPVISKPPEVPIVPTAHNEIASDSESDIASFLHPTDAKKSETLKDKKVDNIQSGNKVESLPVNSGTSKDSSSPIERRKAGPACFQRQQVEDRKDSKVKKPKQSNPLVKLNYAKSARKSVKPPSKPGSVSSIATVSKPILPSSTALYKHPLTSPVPLSAEKPRNAQSPTPSSSLRQLPASKPVLKPRGSPQPICHSPNASLARSFKSAERIRQENIQPSSDDDSSDGMSESLSRLNQKQYLPNIKASPEHKPSEDLDQKKEVSTTSNKRKKEKHIKDRVKESKVPHQIKIKKEIDTDDSDFEPCEVKKKERKLSSNNKESLISVKSELNKNVKMSHERLMQEIRTRQPTIKLKQIVRYENGELAIKKKYNKSLSVTSRQNIAEQFEQSRFRVLKEAEAKRTSSRGSSLDDLESISSDECLPTSFCGTSWHANEGVKSGFNTSRFTKIYNIHDARKKRSSSNSSDLMSPLTTSPTVKKLKRRIQSTESEEYEEIRTNDKPDRKRAKIDKRQSESSDSDKKIVEFDKKKHTKSSKSSLVKDVKETSLKNDKKVTNENSSKQSKDKGERNEPIPGCSKDSKYLNMPTDPISDTESNFSDDVDSHHSSNEADDMEVEVSDKEEEIERVLEPKPEVYQKGKRQVMIIDHAPTPPEHARKQFRAQKALAGSVPRKPVPSNSVNQQEIAGLKKPKKDLKEQLREVEEKRRLQAALDKQPNLPPKVKAAPKVKVTSRNRNQDLLDTMTSTMGVALEKESKVDETPVFSIANADTIDEEKIVPAPKREIPPPPIPIAVQSKTPLNMFPRCSVPTGYLKSMDDKRKPVQPVVPQFTYNSNRNLFGAPAIVETSGGKTVLNYNHKLSVPTNITSEPPHRSREAQRIRLMIDDDSQDLDDEAFRIILHWHPAWLIEQEKHTEPPPVTTEKYKVTTTCLVYHDYTSYVETFFPLILLELWAGITHDSSNKRKTRDGHSENVLNEWPLAVDCITKTSDCPMKRGASNNKKDHFWTKIQCHTLMRRRGGISAKRDLCIITLNIDTLDKKNQPLKKEKEFFGYTLFGEEKDFPLSDSNVIVNQNLRSQHPLAAYKHCFSVVVHLSAKEKVDTSKLGKIKMISYISPKIRDIKALNYLKMSKLFSHILDPKPSKIVFNPNAPIPQHQLIQYVSKLNPTQRAVVFYVAERVKSDDPELLLLHGPPGTGKTRTIVGMILHILLSKEQRKTSGESRILVCTPSNTALDEIICRLEESKNDLPHGTKLEMVRIGDTDQKSVRKYSLDALARQTAENSSRPANLRVNIAECDSENYNKKAEIENIIKTNGSKTILDALQRELKDIENRKKDYNAQLSKLKEEIVPSMTVKKNILEKSNVIFSTLNSCSSSVLTRIFGNSSGKKKPFLCCIVDEASQTTEPETLAPLLLQIEKLILVGDPLQLGATVLSKEAEQKEFDRSLFKRLYRFYKTRNFPNSIMMLTHQYRMHPEILSWPNEYFYKGELTTRCITRSDGDTCPLKPYVFLNLSSKETSNREGQISNEQEVKMVEEVLRTIHLTLKQRRFSIGVITPYSFQKGEISKMVKTQLSNIQDLVKVDTVDSFQGREQDIIIISCVRTDDTGFLKNQFRLNVALTRAKHSLIVIGDAFCLKKDTMWNSLIEDAKKRKVHYDIPASSSPGYLQKTLFRVLSPVKSSISDKDRHRDWLGT